MRRARRHVFSIFAQPERHLTRTRVHDERAQLLFALFVDLNFLDDNAENFSRHTGHGAIVFIGNFDTHCFKHTSQKECTRHPA